jgi:hypothetical protein
MEFFNVVTTSARPTPPVITQPTSSADIVTTVSPGTHPARVNITMPTAKTVDIFFIFLSFYRYWRPGWQILHPFCLCTISFATPRPAQKETWHALNPCLE